jgi:hypothetical protein
MERELIMIKINDSWEFIFDISKTINLVVDDTLAFSIINEIYGENTEYQLEIINNEMYIITEQVIPCVNCFE